MTKFGAKLGAALLLATVGGVALLPRSPSAVFAQQVIYQQWYATGSQAATAATFYPVNKNGVGFFPLQMVILNDDAANNLWVRLDGGTASNAGTDGLTIKIKKGEYRSFSFPQDNGPASFSMASDAGVTTAYRIEAYR